MNILEAASVWKNGGSVRCTRAGSVTLLAPYSLDMRPLIKEIGVSPENGWPLSINDLLSEYEQVSGPYWVIARLIGGEWCESWSPYYSEEDAQAEMEDIIEDWGGEGTLRVIRKEMHP